MAAQSMAMPRGRASGMSLMQIILAASAGTVIEWYDFYIYGSLAVFFATYFFPKGNPTAPCCRRSPRSEPGSPCGRSGRSSSGESAT